MCGRLSSHFGYKHLKIGYLKLLNWIYSVLPFLVHIIVFSDKIASLVNY